MTELEKRLEILMAQHDQETYWKWVQACMDVVDDMNEWEQGFIGNLYDRMEKHPSYLLSPRQLETLERLYASYTK